MKFNSSRKKKEWKVGPMIEMKSFQLGCDFYK